MNERGGLKHGGIVQNVTVAVLDASTPDPAMVASNVRAAYERLVTQYNATILLSPVNTIRAKAAISVSEKYGLINLCVGALGEYVNSGTKYVFTINTPASQLPIPALRTLADKGIKNYIAFVRPDLMAQQSFLAAQSFLSGYGVTLSTIVQLNYTYTDSASVEATIREAFMNHLVHKTFDLVLYCALPAEFASVLVSFNDAQPNVKAAVFGTSVSPVDQAINRLGAIGDMWITTTRFASSFALGVSGQLGGTTAEFIADFKSRMDGRDPTALDPMIGAALMAYYYAVNLTQTIDANTVAQALRTMDRIETFATPIQFNGAGISIPYEVALQNLNGTGYVVDVTNVTFPAKWPWRNSSRPGYHLILKIVLPVVIVCVGITLAGLLISRRQKKQAVLALSQAEEGERRNYRIEYKMLSTGNLIGTGSFGNVFRGEYRGADVCIKKLKMQKFSKQQRTLFAQEASIMVGLRHPNIVLFMGVCLVSPTYCIVTEYMHRGSLFDVIHNEKIRLNLPLILNMLSDILKGLYFIHSSGLVHRDLKSPNLLVDRNWTIKIADFGLSCTQAEASGDAQISLLWTAPEVLLNDKNCYGVKSDIYSFGIVLWEIMARKIPFEGLPVASISPAVVANQRPPISPEWHSGVSSLITSCWHSRSECRPSPKEARTIVETMLESPEFRDEASTHRSAQLAAPVTPAPPSGTVTFVCTTIQHLIRPWNEDPWGTAQAIAITNEMLRKCVKQFCGHEVRNDGLSFLFAFSTCESALAFSIRVQIESVSLPWEENLLKFDETKEIKDDTGDVLFRGLSLRIGIHSETTAIAEKDHGTGIVNYLGKDINIVSELAAVARRGEILLGSDAYSKVLTSFRGQDPYYAEPMGPKLMASGSVFAVVAIFPFKLKGRIALPDQEMPQDLSPRPAPPLTPSRLPHSSSLKGILSHTSRTITVKTTSRSRLPLPPSLASLSSLSAYVASPSPPPPVSQGLLRTPSNPSSSSPKHVKLVFTGSSRITAGGIAGGGKEEKEKEKETPTLSLGLGGLGLGLAGGGGAEKEKKEENEREGFAFPPPANRWIIFDEELTNATLLEKSNKAWEVFEAMLSTENGEVKVLVERFVNQRMTDTTLLELRAETAALRRLVHENVAKYYGICFANQNMCVVMEYCPLSLSSVLQNPDNHMMPWEKKIEWVTDIAKGMWYLHSNGIVHTDLKSTNVMFDNDGALKIVDYGFHRVKTDTQAMTQAGSVVFVAPEVFQGGGHSEAADVYSFGVIIWEIIFQVSPWAGEHTMNIVYKVTRGLRPPITNMPPHTPKHISAIMETCWHQFPAERPAFVDIIAEIDPKILSDV